MKATCPSVQQQFNPLQVPSQGGVAALGSGRGVARLVAVPSRNWRNATGGPGKELAICSDQAGSGVRRAECVRYGANASPLWIRETEAQSISASGRPPPSPPGPAGFPFPFSSFPDLLLGARGGRGGLQSSRRPSLSLCLLGCKMGTVIPTPSSPGGGGCQD